MCLVGILHRCSGPEILSKKEQPVLAAIQSAPSHRENHPKKQPLLNRTATVVPRYDLRRPLPPRHVRLIIGEGLFCQQDAPVV